MEFFVKNQNFVQKSVVKIRGIQNSILSSDKSNNL